MLRVSQDSEVITHEDSNRNKTIWMWPRHHSCDYFGLVLVSLCLCSKKLLRLNLKIMDIFSCTENFKTGELLGYARDKSWHFSRFGD